MKFLLPFLFSLSLALGQTPEELDRTLKKLAPDLVASTVAIMIGQGTGSGVIVSIIAGFLDGSAARMPLRDAFAPPPRLGELLRWDARARLAARYSEALS